MAKKLNLSDFEMLQTLGTGSFGRVRLGKEKSTGQYFALKVLKKAEILRLKQVDHVMSELSILRQIKHPFIVNMVYAFQDRLNLYLIMDYMPGGDLRFQIGVH